MINVYIIFFEFDIVCAQVLKRIAENDNLLTGGQSCDGKIIVAYTHVASRRSSGDSIRYEKRQD